MAAVIKVLDGDGHILENSAAICKFLRPPMSQGHIPRQLGVFPSLDHLHHILAKNPPGAFGMDPATGQFRDPGPEGWLDFMQRAEIEATALYPTSGLAVGRIMDLDFVVAVCQAYNDWLAETYVKRDPKRFRGIGLIPMQEPQAAVQELRRVVKELGFRGAMIPSTGLPLHVGAKEYWPVYAEAERLGCSLAVHGGCHMDLGMNTFNVFAATHAIGHPVGIMVCMASLVFNGVFDRFPGLRIAFLEGGVAWFLMALERFTGSYESFTPYDPRGELLKLQPGEKVFDYILRHIRAGRIYVGVEGDEPALPYAVQVAGPEAFVFSSDFPHEVNLDSVRHEIDELLGNEAISPQAKEAILRKNAARLYKLSPVPAGR